MDRRLLELGLCKDVFNESPGNAHILTLGCFVEGANGNLLLHVLTLSSLIPRQSHNEGRGGWSRYAIVSVAWVR